MGSQFHVSFIHPICFSLIHTVAIQWNLDLQFLDLSIFSIMHLFFKSQSPMEIMCFVPQLVFLNVDVYPAFYKDNIIPT
jgi:hypothetical protein